MNLRLAGPLFTDSIVDGEGLRTTIFVQGCRRHCPGCHNPGTWDLAGGFDLDTDEVKKQLAAVKMQAGITLSGGEPFLQAEALSEVAAYAKTLGLSIWAFTGFLYEELAAGTPAQQALLKQIDVLIDGPFVLNQRSLELRFKGSTNQRTLKLKDGQIVRQID
jgi:anaerobic ribonucleoside-triphosphate reductase activating protein